jgi:predicted metal-dependent phosphoesterase TrpH
LARSSSSSKASTKAPSRPPAGARAAPAALLRRVPWWAVALTLVVMLTAAFTLDPLRDAVTLESVGEARLSQTTGYIAVAPLSDVLDTITLLSVEQHIAIIMWAIALFAVWRVRRARHGTTALREARAALLMLAGVVFVYALAALLPRPMASLALSDDTVLAIDVHAHTKYSHDGRIGWTEDDVRDWHHAAGYDAVYITDHATFEGAERGIASNPRLAGEGTLILQGLEAFYKGEHVNVLGAGRRYKGLTTADLKTVDEQSLALASLLQATSPVLIETLPGKLDRVPAASDTAPGVRAIEIVDGSPRGLTEVRRDRARIVHLADSLDLALVAGSDNHGWGRTAPGWTLMRVPGWRGMTSDSLSARIEEILRLGRRQSTRVVERRAAAGTAPVQVAFAAPVAAWSMLAMLSADERVAWIIWTWAIVIAIRAWRSARARRAAPA